MALLQIRILNCIPTTMIICEVTMNKLKFVVDVIDTVIRVAKMIRKELRKEADESETL